MSFEAAMILAGCMLLWSVGWAWLVLCACRRTIKEAFVHMLVQQRLSEHSARTREGGAMPEGTTLEGLDKGPRTVTLPGTKRTVLVPKAHPCLTEEQSQLRSEVLQEAGQRALRYTDEHRREAKRLRALEAEQAKVEAAEPKGWSPPAPDQLTPYSKLSAGPDECVGEPPCAGGIEVASSWVEND